MHDAERDKQQAELERRLDAVQAALEGQRKEVLALQAELRGLREDAPGENYFLQPRSKLLAQSRRAGVEATAATPPFVAAESPKPNVGTLAEWGATAESIARETVKGEEKPSVRVPAPPSPVESRVPAGTQEGVERPPAPPPPAFTRTAIFTETAAEAAPEVQRSLENRLGSTVFNRVAILSLLIGVALFLKLAFDNHWIHPSPTGKVISGLLLGAGIVLWSERFRRKGYGAFSYSLKAVGTGTLYMALWASFQLYHLLPAGVALTLMVGVTAWNAAMAWTQDSQFLMTYALVGGFATPVLLGSGGNHEVFLFSYLLAMDVAVLLLLAKKPWQRLLLGSFPATVSYFIGWYATFWSADQAGVTGLFAVLLAMPFAGMALFGKQREDFGEGLLAPLGAAGFASLALYSVLEDSGRHGWLAWAAVAMAAVYLLLMRFRRNGIAEAVHLAIVVGLLTVAIPLKAEGRWITVGWLAEGVALLWVAAQMLGPEVQARVRGLMRWMGCGALVLGVAQSLIYWVSEPAAKAFWNARFATEMVAVGALALTAWLARHARRDVDGGLSVPEWPAIGTICVLVAHGVAPLAVSRELAAFWSGGAEREWAYRQELSAFSIASFVMVYAACLVAWLAFGKRDETDKERGRLVGVVAVVYLVLAFVAMAVTPTVGDGNPARVFFNERLIFELCGVAGLALVAWMARLVRRGEESNTTLNWSLVNVASLLAVHLLAALAGVREVSAYWTQGQLEVVAYREQLHVISVAAFLMVYGAVVVGRVAWRQRGDVVSGDKVMAGLLGTAYLAAGSLLMMATPIVGDGGPTQVFWNARLLLEVIGAVTLAVTALIAWRAARAGGDERWREMAAGCFVVFNLLLVLTGVHEIVAYFGVRATGDAGLAEGFSISAWLMLYAAALLVAGFWKQMAFVRWQGLGLLVFTVGKVFLYDTRNLSSGYRVVSFMGLGVVLMAVSFAYQRDWLRLKDAAEDAQ